MGRSDTVLRFGVGSPAGPRGEVWRLWVPKAGDSAYLSGHNLGRRYKISFHPTAHLSGLTTEESRRLRATDKEVLPRHQWQQRSEAAPGFRRLFLVVEPSSEVIYRAPWAGSWDVSWVPEAPPGWATEFQLWKTRTRGSRFERAGFRTIWDTSMQGDDVLSVLMRAVQFDSPELTRWLSETRRRLLSVPDVARRLQSGAELGELVEATWDLTGEPFQIHLALTSQHLPS